MLGTEEVLLAVSEHFSTQVRPHLRNPSWVVLCWVGLAELGFLSPQIHVDEDKFQKLSCIYGLEKILTVEPDASKFHGCRAGALNALVPKRAARLLHLPRQKSSKIEHITVKFNGKIYGNHSVDQQIVSEPVAVFIKPSTQWFGSINDHKMKLQKHKKGSPTSQLVDGIWHVLFSIHSSSAELHEFVRRLEPQRLSPLVECAESSIKSLSKYCKLAKDAMAVKPQIPREIEEAMSAADIVRVSNAKRQTRQYNVIIRSTPKRAKLQEEEEKPRLEEIFARPSGIESPLDPESREDDEEDLVSQQKDDNDDDEIEIEEDDVEEQRSVKDKENRIQRSKTVDDSLMLGWEGLSQLSQGESQEVDLLLLSMPKRAVSEPVISRKDIQDSQEDLLNLSTLPALEPLKRDLSDGIGKPPIENAASSLQLSLLYDEDSMDS